MPLPALGARITPDNVASLPVGTIARWTWEEPAGARLCRPRRPRPLGGLGRLPDDGRGAGRGGGRRRHAAARLHRLPAHQRGEVMPDPHDAIDRVKRVRDAFVPRCGLKEALDACRATGWDVDRAVVSLLTPRTPNQIRTARLAGIQAEEYDGVLDESIEALRILGVDTSGDYDYLGTLRRLVAERKALLLAAERYQTAGLALADTIDQWAEVLESRLALTPSRLRNMARIFREYAKPVSAAIAPPAVGAEMNHLDLGRLGQGGEPESAPAPEPDGPREPRCPKCGADVLFGIGSEAVGVGGCSESPSHGELSAHPPGWRPTCDWKGRVYRWPDGSIRTSVPPKLCSTCGAPATHEYRPPSGPGNREPAFEPRCDAHGSR